ncbi:HD domain-containing protein [Chryseobacterium sp. 'Rf worker isolate 10']|uniref:HD domain-containing protein n=1 Tax=Chryseobacterium sp. 'Rf worker isolate 10' TaxID=2887348 RepID=UPI003D6EBAFE
MNLKNQFEELCSPFTEDGQLIASLWKEIETKYSEKGRHYHNLLHLENMFREFEAVKMNISDFSALSFSVFYHDVIYDATSKANEEKSAAKAEKRLTKLHLHQNKISIISEQILATKYHQRSDQKDTNYLLDADLSVLGKDFETYLEYTQNIRKEYSIYPDFLYKPGRKKVLKHFLELESIFKTEHFKEKYEVQAKENIAAELQLL